MPLRVSMASAGLLSFVREPLSGENFDADHLDHAAELAPLLFALRNSGIGRKKTLTLLGAPGFREFCARLRRLYGAWVEPLDDTREIASRAGATRLLLTHFYPECDGEDILGQCRSRYAGEILLAEDLLRVSV